MSYEHETPQFCWGSHSFTKQIRTFFHAELGRNRGNLTKP